jgi:hypothetical protein
VSRYRCDVCKNTFEAEGSKHEWIDRTYGPCSRWVATCPACGEECQMAKTVHSSGDGDVDLDDGGAGASCGCGSGSCGCGGGGCASCGGC